MRQLVEKYMSGQESLKAVLPQITSLLQSPHQSNNNKLLLVSLMRQSKRAWIRSGEDILQKRYNDLIAGIVNRITGKSISYLSWKEALFNPSSKPKFAISDLTFVGRFHLDTPCADAEFQKFEAPELHLCSAIGITSADGRSELNEQQKLCLDADFNIGYTGTTVDGIGVYQDLDRNKEIMRASKITAKYVSYSADSYVEATQLFDEIPLIFSQVKQQLRDHYAGKILEGACCVLTKIFPQDDSSIQVVTGSVGDCMAFAWNSVSKQVVMLASARQHDFGAQFNPLSIADKLSGSQFQRSIVVLPPGAVIFRMTDGAWQMLPNIQSEVKQDVATGRSYIDTVIDVAKVAELFSSFDESHPSPTENDYRDMLMTEILSAVNATKTSVKKMIDDLQEAFLPSYVQASRADLDKVQFGAFCQWLLNLDKVRHEQFLLMLNRLEYVPCLMYEAPLMEIFNALNNGIDLGDDVLLTVQCAKHPFESNERREPRSCSIL